MSGSADWVASPFRYLFPSVSMRVHPEIKERSLSLSLIADGTLKRPSQIRVDIVDVRLGWWPVTEPEIESAA